MAVELAGYRADVDAEELGGEALVAAGVAQGLADHAHLDLGERHFRADRLGARLVLGAHDHAALAGGEGVDFVDDHPPEPGEQLEAVGIAEQKRKRFGGGQQDMRRPLALPNILTYARIAAVPAVVAVTSAGRPPDPTQEATA